jgi:hypothetical protein
VILLNRVMKVVLFLLSALPLASSWSTKGAAPERFRGAPARASREGAARGSGRAAGPKAPSWTGRPSIPIASAALFLRPPIAAASTAATSRAVPFLPRIAIRISRALAAVYCAYVAKLLSETPNPGRTGARPIKCPWPFVMVHDPKVGMSDWYTWAFFTMTLLWRI